MNIGIIGVGRLGLCFALLLDQGGYRVMGSDIRTNYVAALRRRQIQTTEPGVADMLARSSIEFTTDTRDLIQASDIVYVMVATPSHADGSYDVSAVQRVVDDVASCDFDISDKILVIGCTVNPGDCQKIQNDLRERGVSVLYNPEFIAQGSIIRDLQQADMILIGGEDLAVIDRYKSVYHIIQSNVTPCFKTMSLTAAEIVKIAINCYLTTKISFANMLGEVLIKSGLRSDVEQALSAVAADSRIGHKYMRYGHGFGGPCLPRDNRAFAQHASKIGLDFPLGHIVDRFNQQHTRFVIDDLVCNNAKDTVFYVPSITYKPGTDILEESQQLAVCLGLLERGCKIYIEPNDNLPAWIMSDLVQRFGTSINVLGKQDLIDQGIAYKDIGS